MPGVCGCREPMGAETPDLPQLLSPGGSLRELGVWRSLLRLRATRTSTPEEAGVRGLLASLFAFKSFLENWQRAWVRALNEQACRDGVSCTEPLCRPFSFAF